MSPAGDMSDAKAFIAWLDQQPQVNRNRKIGTQGYCMGGPMTFHTASAVPDRVGAVASFHGGGLVGKEGDANSPHLLAAATKASFLIAIAENDDKPRPNDKDVLKDDVRQGEAARRRSRSTRRRTAGARPTRRSTTSRRPRRRGRDCSRCIRPRSPDASDEPRRCAKTAKFAKKESQGFSSRSSLPSRPSRFKQRWRVTTTARASLLRSRVRQAQSRSAHLFRSSPRSWGRFNPAGCGERRSRPSSVCLRSLSRPPVARADVGPTGSAPSSTTSTHVEHLRLHQTTARDGAQTPRRSLQAGNSHGEA